MANGEAIKFLTSKIIGLEVIQRELSHIYTGVTNLDFSDDVRQRLTSINQMLFALESARNSLEAAESVSPPPVSRIQALEVALSRLDAYVRNDQNIHMALAYLDQVADLINAA
ncbi:MAG: hypothetical protein QOD28_1874 [Acidobacteriota bacterium]|jgi:hypothetical protein|nr:hypothetical protein [Acidobacteriota bacterium]